MTITDRHTKARPLKVVFDQGRNVWVPVGWDWYPVEDNTVTYNIAVRSNHRYRYLNVRLEWKVPSPWDIDLGLFDGHGQNIAWSGAFNNVAADTVWSTAFGPYSGGEGHEEIADVPASDCDHFTVESWSWLTTGERVTLKVWLGRSPS